MAERTDRRHFLNSTLLGACGAGLFLSKEEKILGAAIGPDDAGQARPTSSAPAYQGDPLARGRLRSLEISRLIMGGNLIGGWAHSRDLMYVSSLLKAYNTEAKVMETLALGEQSGITMIQIDPACFDMVETYQKKHGGKIQTLICMRPDPDEKKMREQIKDLVGRGANALYTHGGVTDPLVQSGDIKTLARCMDLIKKSGVPAGIGGHSLEVPIACEKHGVEPEYYVKTFHTDNYWSATPKDHREEFCWTSSRGNGHDDYNDNMFCLDPERTEAFMKSVAKPWFAFKVMAAGAIRPEFAFNFAFKRGADFVIAGMFDFQVATDVDHAVKALVRAKVRERPWRA